MTIPHFAAQQNLVLVPALVALLVAAVAICLPIVFAPALRRGRPGRARALLAVLGLVAVCALVTGGVLGGSAVRVLQNERAQLQQDLLARYGLEVTAGEAGSLIDGGAVPRALPAQAAALDLRDPDGKHPLRLVPAEGAEEGADAYDLALGGEPLPPR